MNKLVTCILFCVSMIFTACDKQESIGRIAVTDIFLNTEAFALKLGETRTLTATIAPENATDNKVVWLSDNETVAMVDATTGVVTGCGIGKATIRAFPATEGTPESHCTVTVIATYPYVVGDLYPDAITPQGIVFWIDPVNPVKGKIVSLDETRKPWGNNELTTSALDSDNGQANMSVIENLKDWRNDYPAFAWCAAKGEGWYLPALNELLALYEAKEILDEIILQNGDTPFATSDYWTSTERRQNSKTTAVTVMFRNTDDNESWASKNGANYVRAIKAF